MIRKAKNKDLNKILEIAKICFDREYYKKHIEKEILSYIDENALYDIDFFVYEINDEIVSYGGISHSSVIDTYKLRLGATLPEYRNQGILTELVEYRINIIKGKLNGRKGFVQTFTKHPNIYTKFGFSINFNNEEYNHHVSIIINNKKS